MMGPMSDPSDCIAHAELVARLAQAPPGTLTVVTPNHRLAQSLARTVGEAHLAAGRSSWPAADILAWDSWLARLHEDAAFDDTGAAVASLLSAEHERLGWESAVARDPGRPLLVGSAVLAREAQGAWRLAHDWGIAGGIGAWEGGEDAQSFARWAAHWKAESQRRGWTDAARLPALVPQLLRRPGVHRPQLLVAYAFSLLTPAQRDVLAACRAAGIALAMAGPPEHAARPVVLALDSPKRELEAAARWARARLESALGHGMPRIAVVVPELAQRRELVRRIFARVLSSSGRPSGRPLFNVSLGRALAEHPLVDAALSILALAREPLPYERASRLLRSPFLGGGTAEAGPRARLDAALRKVAPPLADLALLRDLVGQASERPGRRGAPRCPALDARLAAIAAAIPGARLAAPREWAAHFAAQLSAAGFPGDRSLDSAEHQTLEKWHGALGTLASLDLVAGRITAEAALRHLRQSCADTVFQPESGEAPVQVLGLLESVGLDFDALWVTGLTDDAWPQSPRPHPFLPVSLQRKARVPQASAEESLALDERITRSWATAAPEVVFSHAKADEERALEASPLIAVFERDEPASRATPSYPEVRDVLFAAGREASAWAGCADAWAPPLAEAAARGGTAILADQAACPFRAFARHRLRAEAVEAPEPGLGAAERGQLLHALMARVWRELGSHAALQAASRERLEEIATEAARVAVAKLRAEKPGRLDGRFAELERQRLARAALAWLAIDVERPPFEVVQREEEIVMHAGGLELRGRIDRLDRLAEGRLAVIDYKSGTPRVAGWLGERPDDPQLPLYALALGEEVVAVAFACLKAGKLGFAGLAREDGLLPEVGTVDAHRTAGKLAASWSELLDGWRAETSRLAQAFVRGAARVDPKRPFATCEHCDIGPLCRVRERLGAVGEDETGGQEGEGA